MREPPEDVVFVFGSNLAGRHGRGAALDAARHWGAVYGVGNGLRGRSYAIPTKDERLEPLPLMMIAFYVGVFLAYADLHPDLEFQVTAIGCGLAGYAPADIAPLFARAGANVHLPLGWRAQNRAESHRMNPQDPRTASNRDE